MARSRAKKSPDGKPPGQRKKTIGLPADLARQLATYAAWHGRSEKDVVAEALRPVLAGFYCATKTAADQPAAADPERLRVA